MCSYVDGSKLDDMTVKKSSKCQLEFTSLGDFQIFLLHPAVTPYGLEIESKFQEKPCFAGGKGHRRRCRGAHKTRRNVQGEVDASGHLVRTRNIEDVRLRDALLHQAPGHDGGRSPHVLSDTLKQGGKPSPQNYSITTTSGKRLFWQLLKSIVYGPSEAKPE